MNTSISAEDLKLGEEAPVFGDLRGADGKSYRLSSFDDKPVLALVFVANGCPTVRVYDDRLKALQARYGPAGVQIVAINSNNPFLSPADVLTEMVKKAEAAAYNFPYLKDEDGAVAGSYGAMTTPHAFVFDHERRLRYRGRIDDSRDPSKLTSNDLADALADVLQGRIVRVPDTQPFGCAIVR
jgi:peroxiredoxin